MFDLEWINSRKLTGFYLHAACRNQLYGEKRFSFFFDAPRTHTVFDLVSPSWHYRKGQRNLGLLVFLSVYVDFFFRHYVPRHPCPIHSLYLGNTSRALRSSFNSVYKVGSLGLITGKRFIQLCNRDSCSFRFPFWKSRPGLLLTLWSSGHCWSNSFVQSKSNFILFNQLFLRLFLI